MISDLVEAAIVIGAIYGGAFVFLFYAFLVVMAFSKR